MDEADPAVEGRLAEIVLAHHLSVRLAGINQRDYLPSELLGELPGVLRIPAWSLPSSRGPQTLIDVSNYVCISDYLLDVRMSRAEELIKHGDSPVADITHTVGYANVSKFCEVFRRKFGMTPWKSRFQN